MISRIDVPPGPRTAHETGIVRSRRCSCLCAGLHRSEGGFGPSIGGSIRWLGVALFAAGGALRIWPVFVLGRRFSGLVAIQPGHTLVTRGIYGIIRIRAIWGCSSTRWGGPSRFVRESACCSRARHPAASRAHTRGRDPAAHAVRQRVRCLLQTHVPADSRTLLKRTPNGT
jgi:Isoprenylcysteine carboxyl methyltransferase (ICMT) family